MKAVLDANILVARFIPDEPAHAECLRVVESFDAGAKIIVPLLLPAELAGAIARITGSDAAAQRALMVLQSYSWLRVCLADTAFVERTARLAARHALRGADAFYLALAAEQRCPLVTLDEELISRAPNTITVLRPAESSSPSMDHAEFKAAAFLRDGIRHRPQSIFLSRSDQSRRVRRDYCGQIVVRCATSDGPVHDSLDREHHEHRRTGRTRSPTRSQVPALERRNRSSHRV